MDQQNREKFTIPRTRLRSNQGVPLIRLCHSLISCCILSLAIALSAGANELPGMSIPDSEDPEAWTAAARIGAVHIVPPEGADIRVEASKGGWRVVVTDTTGAQHEAPVQRPQTAEDREAIVWLATSLLSPVAKSNQGVQIWRNELETIPEPTPATDASHSPAPASSEPAAAPGPSEPSTPAISASTPRFRPIGMGLVAGAPTGLSAKGLLTRNRRHAVEIAAGRSGHGLTWAHAGYQFSHPILQTPTSSIRFHLGIGGALELGVEEQVITTDTTKTKDNPGKGKGNTQEKTTVETSRQPQAGLRFPVGADFLLWGDALEVFCDAAPILVPADMSASRVSLSIGVRYYF